MTEKVRIRIVSEDGSETIEEADKEVIDSLFSTAKRLGIPPGILFTFVIADALDYMEEHNGNRY